MVIVNTSAPASCGPGEQEIFPAERVWTDVQSEGGVDRRICEHACLDHARSTARTLLGRLEHQLDRAREACPAVEQESGSAEKHRRVRVVPAGVHDPGDLPGKSDTRPLVDG